MKPKQEVPTAAEFGRLRSLLAKLGLKTAEVSAAIGSAVSGRSRAEIAAGLGKWIGGRGTVNSKR